MNGFISFDTLDNELLILNQNFITSMYYNPNDPLRMRVDMEDGTFYWVMPPPGFIAQFYPATILEAPGQAQSSA